MNKDHFTTGEFAAICNVSKQTLFYYDQQGIFCPDHVGENGYRTHTHFAPLHHVGKDCWGASHLMLMQASSYGILKGFPFATQS